MKSFQVIIVGAGPGGYVAAIRCAQLGLSVAIVEKQHIGGVCLSEGCIPSKALIHAGNFFQRIKIDAPLMGIVTQKPSLEFSTLQIWKNKIVDQLTSGIKDLLKKNKIKVIEAEASMDGPHQILVNNDSGREIINFDSLILASGSREAELPALPFDHTNVISARDALSLKNIPSTMAVVGAGVIGLELGQIYSRLGTKVTILESQNDWLPDIDNKLKDLLNRRIKADGIALHTSVQVLSYDHKANSLLYRHAGQNHSLQASRILIAVGRIPNSDGLNLESLNIALTPDHFIQVNPYLQTTIPHIYAIGDVTGAPMLAHRASRMGIIAAENIAGRNSLFDVKSMPNVVYTHPEIATVGINEKEAISRGINVKTAFFPFSANGRSLTLNQSSGMVKLISDKSDVLIGAQIAGEQASELINECSLAIELGATLKDIEETIHAHPTLGETLMGASEAARNMAIHIFQK